jgi:23S rRNA (adenine2503-C2)-methyltransferase
MTQYNDEKKMNASSPGPATLIIGLGKNELRAYVQKAGFPAFHGTQVFTWVYHRQADGFDLMTDIPLKLRSSLKRDFTLGYFTSSRTVRSREGDTVKYFYPLDGHRGIEAVVLRDDSNRLSFCLSCQIGCPVGCVYCATGKVGFVRNLSAGEIMTEVLTLMKGHGAPGSLLFMGMGEPLLNLVEVKKAISLCQEMGISSRRVTVSTCGIIKGIRDLAHSGLKPRLALSLGSAVEKTREELIPSARGSSLRELERVLVEYRVKTGRRITLEYTLLQGVNDSTGDAEALALFARSVRAHVNLIRYNPLPRQMAENSNYLKGGRRLLTPSSERVQWFRRILEKGGIQVTERYRRGGDINAACGQLMHVAKP